MNVYKNVIYVYIYGDNSFFKTIETENGNKLFTCEPKTHLAYIYVKISKSSFIFQNTIKIKQI